MKKESKDPKKKKAPYEKPVLTKHKELKDIANAGGSGPLGCTRLFI